MKTNSQNNPQHLTAAQVSDTVKRSGLTRQEFAEKVGCGTSQIFKYQKEGLPPRMNRDVRAHILKAAVETGVLPPNAPLRASINKLSKGKDGSKVKKLSDGEAGK